MKKIIIEISENQHEEMKTFLEKCFSAFIHENASDKKAVLTHELIHTLQYERFGSIKAFITQYLKECLEVGYLQSDLEKEAINDALKFYV
jgi:hypothetical protein